MSKINMILENVQNRYNMTLLEESNNLGELETLKGRMLVTEAAMTIRKALIEEGTVENVKGLLQESWESRLMEEMNIKETI